MNNKLGFSRTLRGTLLKFIAYPLVDKSLLCNQRVILPSNSCGLMQARQAPSGACREMSHKKSGRNTMMFSYEWMIDKSKRYSDINDESGEI